MIIFTDKGNLRSPKVPYAIQRYIDDYLSAVSIRFHRYLYGSSYILLINKALQALCLQIFVCLTFYR